MIKLNNLNFPNSLPQITPKTAPPHSLFNLRMTSPCQNQISTRVPSVCVRLVARLTANLISPVLPSKPTTGVSFHLPASAIVWVRVSQLICPSGRAIKKLSKRDIRDRKKIITICHCRTATHSVTPRDLLESSVTERARCVGER